jgi:hypothetical protein
MEAFRRWKREYIRRMKKRKHPIKPVRKPRPTAPK